MAKKHYLLNLIPPRPTFAQDMTAEERLIMQAHVAYWSDLMEKGRVLIFGPVMGPVGVYGVGVIEVENEDEMKSIIKDDPAVSINKYETYHFIQSRTPANSE